MQAVVYGPLFDTARPILLNERRIKVRRHYLWHLLPDHARAKRVRTPDFHNTPIPNQHLGYKLIPRPHEPQPPRIITPNLAAHKPEPLQSLKLRQI